MGLKFFLDNTRYYKLEFTVNGNLEEVRAFIKTRCHEKGYNGLSPTEDKWFGSLVCKKATISCDSLTGNSFKYDLEYLKDRYLFSGIGSGDNTTITIVISYGTNGGAKYTAETIKQSIINKFQSI